MKRAVSTLMVLGIIFYSVITAFPNSTFAGETHNHNYKNSDEGSDDILVEPVTVITITIGLLCLSAATYQILTGGPDPIAETENYAYAGDWCCGGSNSDDDEAFFPDLLAESNTGVQSCRHGASAYSWAEAKWLAFDSTSSEAKGQAKGNSVAKAPASCYGIARGTAGLLGSTRWKKNVGVSLEGDSLHMQAKMSFDELMLTALNYPGIGRSDDDTATLMVNVYWDADTLTVFDGSLINNGDSIETTGDFIGLDIVRSDSGDVTFGTWPDTLILDFYVPDSTLITIDADVFTAAHSSAPLVCTLDPCLDCQVTTFTPRVPNNAGNIIWDMDVFNCGEVPFQVFAEMQPTIGDCANGVPYLPYAQNRLLHPDLHPGENFTGHYYLPVNGITGVSSAALNFLIGPQLGNWINQCCFDFIFSYPFGRNSSQTDFSGLGVWSERFNGEEIIPQSNSLEANYPNPFNATTTIPFEIVDNGEVDINIYNLAGQLVENLSSSYLPAGHHTITWNASKYNSGVYFYKLTTGEKTFTKRMSLIK